MFRPYAIAAGREDAVRIDRILERFAQSAQGVVVIGIGVGHPDPETQRVRGTRPSRARRPVAPTASKALRIFAFCALSRADREHDQAHERALQHVMYTGPTMLRFSPPDTLGRFSR